MATGLTANLDGDLTWGDLINFVDAARSQVVRADFVEIVMSSSHSEDGPVGLAVALPGLPRLSCVQSEEQVEQLGLVVQAILDNEGDARPFLNDLAAPCCATNWPDLAGLTPSAGTSLTPLPPGDSSACRYRPANYVPSNGLSPRPPASSRPSVTL